MAGAQPGLLIPSLTTPRLELRGFVDEDLDAWASLVADPCVGRFVGGAQDRATAWRSIALFVGHWALRGFGQWAVCLRGRLIGRCGLWQPEGWPELEVGWLFARDVWGIGDGTPAHWQGPRGRR